MLKTNLNNFPPSSLQLCRFTISRRKRPAEPLQHGAHGTGWGAAATAAHVPQLRWQFRGRVLNNAECPKSSCHTRNYCLTRERRIERERKESRETSMTTTWKWKWEKFERRKSTGTPAIPLTHTSHSSTHTHTPSYTQTRLESKISISTFLFLILLLNLRSGHFWIFFYNFYTHIFVVISGMITITIAITIV